MKNKNAKRVLSVINTTGKKFRASGSTFCISAVLLILCAVLRPPLTVFVSAMIFAFIWVFLCIASCIPVIDPEKENLKKRIIEETQYAEETLAKHQKAQELNEEAFRKEHEARETAEKELSSVKRRLCKQMCFRITECLRQYGLESAAWDFVSLDPESMMINGEPVRISLKDADDYSLADVKFLKSGIPELNLIKKISPDTVHAAVIEKAIKKADDPDEVNTLREWIKDNESRIEDLCYDGFSKGRDSITITQDLPDKNYWPRLCGLLDYDGAYESVTALENGIVIQFKKYKKASA